jgi:sterol desaturase/sphingolipid hydroxylase (fatty acid hydroxylase superfamily)
MARRIPLNWDMRLSKWGYQADFIVYPVLIAGVALRSLWSAPPPRGAAWLAAAALGLLAWTLLEYTLHRWVLHGVPPFRQLHAQHHEHQGALIGTPTWVSAPLFLGLWAAIAHAAGDATAGGAAAGLMTGYLIYAFIHDAVHHRAARPGSWLFRAKTRHALHHRPGAHCNFGVSSGAWDAVLRTAADR